MRIEICPQGTSSVPTQLYKKLLQIKNQELSYLEQASISACETIETAVEKLES